MSFHCPLPESSHILCPLLSLSIPLPAAKQHHLSNNLLVFQLILRPLSATVFLMVNLLPFVWVMTVSIPFPFHIGIVLDYAGVALAFVKMRAAYAHLTKKSARAAKICVSEHYRSNYHFGQKHEQQQQIQARVQTYSLNQSFPAIAAFVELDSSNY